MGFTDKQQFLAVQTQTLTPEKIMRWRKARGLGQGHFGKLFREVKRNGYHRTYISRVERGLMPVTDSFAEHFETVRAQWQREHNERRAHSGLIHIVSKYRMPRSIKITRQPRKCACGDWFVPCSARHTHCGDCR